MELEGANVLVTGASTGIGADLAVRLAREGATVGVVARRQELLEQVVADCREHAPDSQLWALDLSDLDAAAQLVRDAWDAFGHLDAIVNNAGAPKRRHAVELTFDDVEYINRLNYLSPARMCLEALPRMLERGSGALINVASTAGRCAAPREAAYSASKAALSMFSEGIAIDLHGGPVDVFLVQPGPIDTPIWRVEGEDPSPYDGEKFPPSDVSDVIVELLRTGEGPMERFVPANYAEFQIGKAEDIDGWIAGAAAWADAVLGSPFEA